MNQRSIFPIIFCKTLEAVPRLTDIFLEPFPLLVPPLIEGFKLFVECVSENLKRGINALLSHIDFIVRKSKILQTIMNRKGSVACIFVTLDIIFNVFDAVFFTKSNAELLQNNANTNTKNKCRTGNWSGNASGQSECNASKTASSGG